jgi:hypothetical protein
VRLTRSTGSGQAPPPTQSRSLACWANMGVEEERQL